MSKFTNFRKSKLWLFMLLTMIVGASPVWAQKTLPYSYGFENDDLAAEGWTVVNGASNYNGKTGITTTEPRSDGYCFTFLYSTNPPQTLFSPELATSNLGIKVSFWYKAYSSKYPESFQFGYSTTDNEASSFNFDDYDEVTTTSTAWTEYKANCPAGTKYICIKYTANNQYYLFIDDITVKELSQTAELEVDATPIAFGLVSGNSSKSILLKNAGAAQMTGVTVTYTATTGDADAITLTPALSGGTIDANSQQTVTVAVNTAKAGAFSGTIRIEATDQETVEIPVSGHVLDNTKIIETFASLPDRWTEYAYKTSGYYGSTYNWSYSADGAYNTNENSTLTSPKIAIAEGETLAISVKMKSSYSKLYIDGSTDNGQTWTAYTKTLDANTVSTSEHTLVVLDDIDDVEIEGKRVNKLRFRSEQAYLKVFNGFTYAADPQLGLFSDEACTVAVAKEISMSFGLITEAQTRKYYIKNTGTGQMGLAVNTPTGFTAEIDKTTLGASEVATLTITMPATEGEHNEAITVTATNHDTSELLGIFTVNASGTLRDVNKFYQELNTTALPAGWQTEGTSWNFSETDGAYNTKWYLSDNARLITPRLEIAEGEVFIVEAKGYSTSNTSYQHLQMQYSADGTTWTNFDKEPTLDPSNWKTFSFTGVPAGKYFIAMNVSQANVRMFYGGVAQSEPIINFTAADKSFGMITADATSDAYTIKNEGTATLSNLKVICDNQNFTVAVADNATSVAANGGTATFTVTLKADAKGMQQGTVTVSGDGVESKTFKVSGYVADQTKIFETFATLPDRWENSTNPAWSFSSGDCAYASSYNYSGGYNYATLTSPKIKIINGDKLAISAKLQYSGSYYVTINGSSDNGATWTAYTKKLSNDVLNNSTYTVVEIDDIPTTVNKLQLVGYYAYINGLNGFTYDQNDPKLGIFSDADYTQAITAATATNNWGFVSEAKTATYYIKNTGTGTMTLATGSVPGGFAVGLPKTTLNAGESTTLTITMEASDNNDGYHSGDITLTAKDDAGNEIGTFTVTATGVVVGQKTDVNFASLSEFPIGWEASGWTLSSYYHYATASYTQGTLTTGSYEVKEGESLVIQGKKNDSTGSLTYRYSTDGGNSWTNGTQSLSFSSTRDFEMKTISDIPAAEDVKIQFIGKYVDIQRIYGYSAVAKANMVLDPAATAYDFGMQTEEATYVITVTNNGTKQMTGLKAIVNTSDYTATVSSETVDINGTATVTVTQKYDASKGMASLADVLTISADGLAAKTINLSGKTRDAAKYFADFQEGMPNDWTANGWSSNYTGSNYFAQAGYNGTNTLTTPGLTLAANEQVSFDVWSSYGSGTLTVRYTTNGGIDWTETTVDFSATQTTQTLSLGNEQAVTAYIQFIGNNVRIDNFYGGTETTAPLMAVYNGNSAMANGDTKAFGTILEQKAADITIKNIGSAPLTISNVEATGEATATVSATELAAGASVTLTITMPVAAPYGAKSGTVTVATSLGNFIVNYTATIMNPNALDEQFANGMPAGWYFGGYWEVSSQQGSQQVDEAQNAASGVADLITEQLTVTGENDALTFQAARSSSSNAPTFKVYTSQNRTDWTEADLSGITLTTSYQTITLSGLSVGNYYVKISGARVKVDNFLGWEKKNNEHDLYVTATSFPTATQTIGSTVSVSATVTSLIANEEGVYAKLFINGEVAKNTETIEGQEQEVEVAATAANVALRGSQTFTMSYTLPATPGTYKAQIKVYYSDGTVAFTTAENNITVDYPSLTLNEGSKPSLEAGTYNVTLSRTFAQGWTTVCLPFDFTPAQIADGAKAYAFTGYSNGELSFGKVETMEAGKPYIVYMPETVSENIEIGTIAIKAAQPIPVTFGNATFTGTYAPMDAGTMQGKYGVTGAGKIAKAGEKAWMNGFRAYFDLPAESGARLAFYDEATGIARVVNVKELNSDAYNLKGQRVESLKKGNLYIIGGKKVMVK